MLCRGLRRAFTHAACVAVAPRAAASTTCATRPFGGFFTRTSNAPTCDDAATPTPLSAMNVNVEDLAKGDDMPPMLQYNESLVEAALELLERTNNAGDLEESRLQSVSAVVAMLFSEHLVSPWEQYEVVASLLDIPQSRDDDVSVKAARAILLTILPDALAQLVCVLYSSSELRSATDNERELVHNLVRVIIDNGGMDGATPEDIDKALLEALQAIETGFPALFNHTNFVFLLQDMNRVCLQARFAYLVNETCLAFDPERTGRISAAELKDCLAKIMPPHAVERFMSGVEADDDGKLFYPQLALLLMRGEGPVAAQGENSTTSGGDSASASAGGSTSGPAA